MPDTLPTVGRPADEVLRELLRRFVWALSDESGATPFGIPEAMWHITVKDFPAIVTMDAHGNSLHADLKEATGKVLAELKR